MQIIPWKRHEPNEIVSFRNEMNDLFRRFFDVGFPKMETMFKDSDWLPSVDISEGKSQIVVKAEIPGVEAKDIDLAVEGRRLTIKGEKKQEKEEKGENFHRMERSYGYFNRAIELPADVDGEDVDAAYKKGILTIKLKKIKAADVKRITVKAEKE